VDLVEVDVVGAEPAQAVVDLCEYFLPGQPGAIRPLPHRVAELGGYDDGVAVGEVIQCPAEDLFAGALGVHAGRVEEVDTGLEGVLDQGAALLLAQRPHRMASLRLPVGHAAQSDG